MRAKTIGLFLSAVLSAGSACAYDNYDSRGLFANPVFANTASESGYDANDPRNCTGPDWDDTRVLGVSKVVASPRIHFVKSPYDDDFKAATCPAATGACRKRSYLETGDLVLVGKTQGDFTCVSYQSRLTKIQTRGWLPNSALSSVAPMPSPGNSDWLGMWDHPHGSIEIRRGGIGGRLRVEGIMVVPTARDVHTGAIDAQVAPGNDAIAFLNDGWLPFETKCDSGCRVRMQRIGPWLLVEDNGDCGGAGVSFTGLYRRKP